MKRKTLLIARICKRIKVGKWSLVLTSLFTLTSFILICHVYPETLSLPFTLLFLIALGLLGVTCLIATILCLAISFLGTWIERRLE